MQILRRVAEKLSNTFSSCSVCQYMAHLQNQNNQRVQSYEKHKTDGKLIVFGNDLVTSPIPSRRRYFLTASDFHSFDSFPLCEEIAYTLLFSKYLA